MSVGVLGWWILRSPRYVLPSTGLASLALAAGLVLPGLQGAASYAPGVLLTVGAVALASSLVPWAAERVDESSPVAPSAPRPESPSRVAKRSRVDRAPYLGRGSSPGGAPKFPLRTPKPGAVAPSDAGGDLWKEWIPDAGELPVTLIGPVLQSAYASNPSVAPVEAVRRGPTPGPNGRPRVAEGLGGAPENVLRGPVPPDLIDTGPTPAPVFGSVGDEALAWTDGSPIVSTVVSALPASGGATGVGSAGRLDPRPSMGAPAGRAVGAVHAEALEHVPPHLRGAATRRVASAAHGKNSVPDPARSGSAKPTASPPATDRGPSGAICPTCGSYASLGPNGILCRACGGPPAPSPGPAIPFTILRGPAGRRAEGAVLRVGSATPSDPCRVVEVAGHDARGSQSFGGGTPRAPPAPRHRELPRSR
jgi:hypothetical protein